MEKGRKQRAHLIVVFLCLPLRVVTTPLGFLRPLLRLITLAFALACGDIAGEYRTVLDVDRLSKSIENGERAR